MAEPIKVIQFIKKTHELGTDGKPRMGLATAGVLNEKVFRVSDISITPITTAATVAGDTGESFFAQTGRIPEYEPLEITITGTPTSKTATTPVRAFQHRMRTLSTGRKYYIRFGEQEVDTNAKEVPIFDAYWGRIKSIQLTGTRPVDYEATIVLEVSPYMRRVQDSTIHPNAGSGTTSWSLYVADEVIKKFTWLKLMPEQLDLTFGAPQVRWGMLGAYVDNKVESLHVPEEHEVPTYFIPQIAVEGDNLNFISKSGVGAIRIYLEFGGVAYANPALI